MRVFLLLGIWLQVAEPAKILVFIPFPMKSHHFAFQPIVRELAERGHQVTYLTAVPMEKPLPTNLRQVLVPNVLNTLQHDVLPGFVSFGKMSTPMKSLYFGKAGYTVMDATLGHPEAQKIIHSDEKYDLVIHEAFFVSEPVVALQHKFGAPGVALMPLADSSWLHEMSGLTDNPAYMIDFKTDFTDKLTFLQRVHNLYHLTSTLLVSYAQLYSMQGLMDKYFNYTGWENRPSIVHLLGDQALILVNSHHSVGYNFPRAPHVKEVGGINLRTPKPLPKDLEQLLNDSPDGVIYFSLGSNINMSQVSSKGIRDAFSNVFAKLKQRVLWKWTGKDFPQVPANVYMSDWFPQQDILVHKNVKLFITHGGLLSTTEAVNSAVPLLGIPFFADQRKNLRQISTVGFGVGLDFENLTESSISWAVNELLNNRRDLVILLAVLLNTAGGARILVFLPLPAKSHHSVYSPIVRSLAARGHNVTFYTHFPVEDPPANLRTVLLKPPTMASVKKDNEAKAISTKYQAQTNPLLLTISTYLIAHQSMEMIVKRPEVQDLMRSDEEYDLVINSAGYAQQCISTLGHKFKAPTVQIVPVGDVSFMLEMAGAPDNPSYMMNTHTEFSERMTFVERLQNVMYWTFNRALQFYVTVVKQRDTMDKYLTYPGWEGRPSIMEMSSDAALVLVNSHHSIGYSFPKSPHFKEIGGINVLESKALPDVLQKFLDSATDGAIYFSLGSVVSVSEVTGVEMRKTFCNVFRRAKLKVLWKWETDDFPEKPPNVMTSKWFPQQDVLAHGNVKAFITQGGMMSIYEAVSRGVPLLGIPFFGDQKKNLKHATTYGYGLEVDYANITEQSIQWALDELIYNPRYKTEAERRKELFHDRPMKPLDEATYWIEYVLRYGRVLQPASVHMPFYQLYLIDLLATTFVILSILVFILKRTLVFCKSIFNNIKRNENKRE